MDDEVKQMISQGMQPAETIIEGKRVKAKGACLRIKLPKVMHMVQPLDVIIVYNKNEVIKDKTKAEGPDVDRRAQYQKAKTAKGIEKF